MLCAPCSQGSGPCLSISGIRFVAVVNSGQTYPFSPKISVPITSPLSFLMTQINTVLPHLFLLSSVPRWALCFAPILSLINSVQKENLEAAA